MGERATYDLIQVIASLSKVQAISGSCPPELSWEDPSLCLPITPVHKKTQLDKLPMAQGRRREGRK